MGSDSDNSRIQQFNTVLELQTILTTLTSGMNTANVLVTDENNSIDMYVTLREGAVKIGSKSNLDDNEQA